MAKGKYEYWRTPEGLIRMQGWSLDGLTDVDIAHNIGINVATLYRWKESYSEICEALKETKEIIDRKVENALYIQTQTGNVTAMIFWLKNRQSKKWRDRIENSIITEEPIKIQMDYSKLSTDELKKLIELAEKAKIK